MSRGSFLNNQCILPTRQNLYENPGMGHPPAVFCQSKPGEFASPIHLHHLSGISLNVTPLTPHPCCSGLGWTLFIRFLSLPCSTQFSFIHNGYSCLFSHRMPKLWNNQCLGTNWPLVSMGCMDKDTKDDTRTLYWQSIFPDVRGKVLVVPDDTGIQRNKPEGEGWLGQGKAHKLDLHFLLRISIILTQSALGESLALYL